MEQRRRDDATRRGRLGVRRRVRRAGPAARGVLAIALLVGCSAEPPQDARPDPPQPSQPTPTITTRPTGKPPPTSGGLVVGADISWPQCPKGMGIPERPGEGQPMPRPGARFVVVGLTNGPAFHPNPCLHDQLEELRRRGVALAAYAVANHPNRRARLRDHGDAGPYDPGTRAGRLSNFGHAQASFNVGTMRAVGLASPVVWVDVEPYPLFPWSPDVEENRAVVDGIVRGYTDAGLRVGFYSAQGLWRSVLGSTSYGLPEWRTAGTLGRRHAMARCRPAHSFQGGDPVISQWYTATHDFDLLCPGVELADWFATG